MALLVKAFCLGLSLTDRNIVLIIVVSSNRLFGNVAGDAHSETPVNSEGETKPEHWYFMVILWAAAVFSLIRHVCNYSY